MSYHKDDQNNIIWTAHRTHWFKPSSALCQSQQPGQDLPGWQAAGTVYTTFQQEFLG